MYFFAHINSSIQTSFDVKVYEIMHCLHGKSFSDFQQVSDVIDVLQNSLEEAIDSFFGTYQLTTINQSKPKFVLVPSHPVENNWSDISISVEFDNRVISRLLLIKENNS